MRGKRTSWVVDEKEKTHPGQGDSEQNQGRAGVDWVDVDPAHFEIGGDVLRDVCQQAVALRVQG